MEFLQTEEDFWRFREVSDQRRNTRVRSLGINGGWNKQNQLIGLEGECQVRIDKSLLSSDKRLFNLEPTNNDFINYINNSIAVWTQQAAKLAKLPALINYETCEIARLLARLQDIFLSFFFGSMLLWRGWSSIPDYYFHWCRAIN